MLLIASCRLNAVLLQIHVIKSSFLAGETQPSLANADTLPRPGLWEPLYYCKIVRTSKGGSGLLLRSWPGPWRVFEAPEGGCLKWSVVLADDLSTPGLLFRLLVPESVSALLMINLFILIKTPHTLFTHTGDASELGELVFKSETRPSSQKLLEVLSALTQKQNEKKRWF